MSLTSLQEVSSKCCKGSWGDCWVVEPWPRIQQGLCSISSTDRTKPEDNRHLRRQGSMTSDDAKNIIFQRRQQDDVSFLNMISSLFLKYTHVRHKIQSSLSIIYLLHLKWRILVFQAIPGLFQSHKNDVQPSGERHLRSW